MKKNVGKRRKIIINCLKILVLVLSLVMIFLSLYINYSFLGVTFEQLLLSLIYSEGTSFDAMKNGLIFVLGGITCSLVLIFIIRSLLKKTKDKCVVFIKLVKKVIYIDLYNVTNKKDNLLLTLLILFSCMFTINKLGIGNYVKNQLMVSDVFEKYYINGRDVNISFPLEKQNLIYIFVESLEMTNASIQDGGGRKNTVVSNLEKLALDNTNFSNTDKLGGALSVSGTTWTVAGMMAQTAGVPLKVEIITSNQYNGFGASLPGVYNLGDILKGNGYKNYLMMGSDASFGGRKDYFSYHGDYTIYDYQYAKDNELIDSDYHVWWGYEDKKLFSFAKDKLEEISKKDEPFNFTILTADTHFVDGYLDESCPVVFDDQYSNVFNCADIMIVDFIKWIQKQDFYQNTTIIISGDHLTMQDGYYSELPDGYDRNIYNVIINSKTDPINTKNRIFSTLDMFPTTLAALGVDIEGNRLGLGTNLFSTKKTVAEETGIDVFSKELSKRSKFYNKYILGDTYYKMITYKEN